MVMRLVRLACDSGGCRAVFEGDTNDLHGAIAAARIDGWAVSYEGAGHGWISHCRLHRTDIPRFLLKEAQDAPHTAGA